MGQKTSSSSVNLGIAPIYRMGPWLLQAMGQIWAPGPRYALQVLLLKNSSGRSRESQADLGR